MARTEKKHRIIFIDLMRAFAVIQMVQGHTVDVLLAPEYRLNEYPLYFLWNFMRGMTAPIFMFTAGTVFTYLFRLNDESLFNNPRVWKGIKRFLLLVFLGYLLRYPTFTIFDFSEVSEKSLRIFFAVDVLQLIGFGILFLVLTALVSEVIKISDYISFLFVALFFFLLTPIVSQTNWLEIFPKPLANYFYTDGGSLFPLFPWAGYVVLGGVLGSYLAKNPLVFRTNKFSFQLASAGTILIALAYFSKLFIAGDKTEFLSSSYALDTITFRIGFVLLLNALVSFISQKLESIPRIIILVGRNTLLIYVVHLIILYGSAWNPGLYGFLGNSVSVYPTVFAALAMITLMTLMVYVLSKLKFRNKQLVT